MSEPPYRIGLDQSALLQDLSARTPPSPLYHYTTRPALLRILETRTVQLSAIRYLNDATELQYAFELAQKVISSRASSVTGELPELYRLLVGFHQSLRDSTEMFVFSMSANGDQLSQWRAYCKPADGYAIGFDSLALRTVAEKTHFLLPCEYSEAAQVQLLEKLLREVEADFHRNRPTVSLNTCTAGASGYFIVAFHLVAPMLKHPAFREEQEWRLVSKPFPQPTGHRPGPTLLVPYAECSLAGEGVPPPIAEVVVGPTPHSQLELRALKSLQARLNLDAVVRASTVPYRPW